MIAIRRPHWPKTRNQQGFTILELMIATLIMSVILLVVTTLLISIGNLYYKGISESRLQTALRAINNDVTERLQFYNGDPTAVVDTVYPEGTMHAVCIGNVRYSYITGRKIDANYPTTSDSDTMTHVLWRDATPDSGCQAAELWLSEPSTGGTELIPPNSRLSNFSISTSSPYTISITIAYGDGDLFDNPAAANPHCKGDLGEQYCAVASSTITTTERLRKE